MKSYLEQETLALLRHQELLAEAEWQRQYGHLRHQQSLKLAALFQALMEQVRGWVAPRPAVSKERIVTATRQEAC